MLTRERIFEPVNAMQAALSEPVLHLPLRQHVWKPRCPNPTAFKREVREMPASDAITSVELVPAALSKGDELPRLLLYAP